MADLVRCEFCRLTRKRDSALMVQMSNGKYRCKGVTMCLRRARAIL